MTAVPPESQRTLTVIEQVLRPENLPTAVAREVNRLLHTGGCDPDQVKISTLIRVALENVAANFPVDEADYRNLKHF